MVTTSWTYSTSLHSYTCSIAHLLDSLTHFHSFHLNNSSHSLTHSRSLNHSLVHSLSAMFLNEKNCWTITQSLTHSRLLTHTFHTHSTHFSTLTAPNFTHLLICWNRVDTKKSDPTNLPEKACLDHYELFTFFLQFLPFNFRCKHLCWVFSQRRPKGRTKLHLRLLYGTRAKMRNAQVNINSYITDYN